MAFMGANMFNLLEDENEEKTPIAAVVVPEKKAVAMKKDAAPAAKPAAKPGAFAHKNKGIF